jgi:NADP-dependent 3-hydroxy acid dehydrogenase YdfG
VSNRTSNPHGRPLSERTALVAGASSGMGAAIATALLEQGVRVHALARREELIAENVGRTYVDSQQLITHGVDLADAAATHQLLDQLAADDPIDLLVAAAGVNVKNRRFDQLTDDAWDQVINVNLSGIYRLLRGALPQLQRHGGDAVLISSVAAHWPDHSGAAYQASKAGLSALARGASRDVHGSGVRITTINPGIVDTPLLDKRPEPPPAEVRAWCTKPEDIAAAVICAVSLPPRAHIADMTIVSTRLQSLGNTQQATPALPDAMSA